MVNTRGAVGSAQKNITAPARRILPLRGMVHTFMYSYAIVLLLVVTVLTVCLLLDWRPSQAWVSFFSRFATSPAIAGLLALGAAFIGARSLANQLAHTKEKAAYEAWWQQFEWVTDRTITSGPSEDSEARLPQSLAFDLMNSLSRSAAAPFQVDAVGGILKHYLKDFMEQPRSTREQEGTPSSTGPGMNEEGASSLRNLINGLPESSSAGATARRMLDAYEYELEVVKALRHKFGDAVSFETGGPQAPDAIIDFGSQKIVVDVKLFTNDRRTLERAGTRWKRIMADDGKTHVVIITAQTTAIVKSLSSSEYGIHLIEWDPSQGSSNLYSKIISVVPGLKPRSSTP